jgi:hypothetical protein
VVAEGVETAEQVAFCRSTAAINIRATIQQPVGGGIREML